MTAWDFLNAHWDTLLFLGLLVVVALDRGVVATILACIALWAITNP